MELALGRIIGMKNEGVTGEGNWIIQNFIIYPSKLLLLLRSRNKKGKMCNREEGEI